MPSFSRLLTVGALAVAIALAMGMGMGAVAAQDDAGNESDGDGLEDRHGWTMIDSETYITDWEYSDQTFRVDVHAKERTTITMAESADWDEGEGQYATRSETVPAGNSTIVVETYADESDGVALSFATQLSMQQERGPYISTGSSAEDPFRHFGGTSGLFSGVGMTVGLAGLGAYIVIRQEESGVVKA
ncbi:hypothetical protein [Halopiger goleimassiliensis]|uniref:hypothetical protein n=1 Tax=Halopiger goleimassiliensis TaxID=1293048 RepID=UPI000677C594|nr:hypothetical protein [Halopiger goleimassiliensis]